MGPGDHSCHEGKNASRRKGRDKHDYIIVQEKLDGSNVGVARLGGEIYALTGRIYRLFFALRTTSSFEKWVNQNKSRFLAALQDGERLCGEWLIQAHGTRYELPHEPLVVFDLMTGTTRWPMRSLFRG